MKAPKKFASAFEELNLFLVERRFEGNVSLAFCVPERRYFVTRALLDLTPCNFFCLHKTQVYKNRLSNLQTVKKTIHIPQEILRRVLQNIVATVQFSLDIICDFIFKNI